MGAEVLLTSLQARGAVVSLTPEGKIRVEAPEAALDDVLRDQIRQERDGLIALLQTIAQDEKQVCQVASFASAASAAIPEGSALRRMRTQRSQISSPNRLPRDEFRNGALAPIPPGLPASWQAGLEQLALMLPPTGFTEKRWAIGIVWARRIAFEHGPAAFVMGWNAEELFGLHPAAPSARYDAMGLAFTLDETWCVASLNDERAIISHANGTLSTFRRTPHSPESRCAWEVT
jgi:hypothetical protein